MPVNILNFIKEQKNIWRFLKSEMQKFSGKPALVFGELTISYSELINIVEADNMPGTDKVILAAADNKFNQAVMILKALKNGKICVPVNADYGDIYLNRIKTELDKYSDEINNDNETALIMFTSGSTGAPKGVCLTHDNIISNITAIVKYFKIDDNDSILISRPLMHAAVLTGEFFISLYKGLTIHLYPEAFNPLRLIKYINENSITTFCGTPTLFNLICRSLRGEDCLPLKNIAVSGEILTPKIARAMIVKFPDARIYSVYGLTEASPRVSYLPPHKFEERICFVGKPINGVSMKLLDSENREVSDAGEGRLYINSRGIMKGYLGNPELTARKIKDGWLDTGDIAYRDSEGYYYILGRADNMLIRGGMNIYPEEIERTLTEDEKIEKVLCYGEPDELLGLVICVKVVTKEDEKYVREIIKQKLPEFMRPGRVKIVSELELTESGKVKRQYTGGGAPRQDSRRYAVAE